MRKFLSLVMMAMLAVGAWAAEVTDVLTGSATGVSGSSYTEWSGVTLNSDAVYAGQSAGTYGSIQLRSKNNNSGVITTTSGGAVKSVTVVFNSNTMDGRTLNVYGKNTAYSAATDLYDGSLQGDLLGSFVKGGETSSLTVSGDYEYIAFRSAADAMYIESITIVWETSGDTPVQTVTPPTFSPVAGEVEAGTAVTISAPAAEMIVYTTDGTNPSYANNVGDIYTEPIVVNEAMTIKAIAVDSEGNESAVATAAYTIKPEAVSVATVAEFNALDNNTECTFAGTLVVSAQTGKYLYAQDATGGILIFGTAGQTYSKLDVIPAGWTGKKTIYNGAPEAANPAGLAEASTQADLAPEEMTPAQVVLANAFKYAVIRGATVTMTDNNNGTITVGDETVALYKRFNITIPTDGGVYDIIGVTGYYNGAQFMPLEFVAQATEVAAPVITGETPFIGSTTVTITCEEEGATVRYTTDGTDPTINSTEYTAPFEITETTTVKAIAFNEAEDCSPIVSKEFVKTLTVATAAEYLALEDGTEFVFTGNLVVSGQAGQRLYAQDETGGVLIYGNAGQTYKFGDVIPAGFSAKKANYNGTIEMANMSGMQAATETAELVAKEVAIADYSANQNVYVVVKNATIDGTTLVVGEETLATYNRFGVDYPTDDKAYDVYGVATIYNNAPQLHPISFVEYQEPVVESFISYTAQQERGTVAVTLEDGTAVESLVTKVAEGTKFTVTATAAQGYMVTNIEVKAGEIVITPTTDPYEGEFSAPALKAEGAREMSQTFEMPADDVAITVTFDTRTGIENINMDNVKAVRFFNAAGVESATPFQGVNIVVREMNDGSKVVTKMVK